MDATNTKQAEATTTKQRRPVTSYPREHPPIAVPIREAGRLSGLGRTKLQELIRKGRLDSVLIDDRRLILMHSLKRLLGVA
jgi:hypothetical protein